MQALGDVRDIRESVVVEMVERTVGWNDSTVQFAL